MAKKKYDFAGLATMANMKCTDGRTIMTGAFKDDDGRRVPLCWNHKHDSPDNVLGHADLEYTDDGVMAYCSFNDSDNAQKAKTLVEHGDITALSIHANGLIQDAVKNVLHGVIREVSLVYAGANPGASISQIGLEHADADEGIIYTGEEFSLWHADEISTESKKEESTKNEKPSEEPDKSDDETVGDILSTLNKKQQNAVSYLLGEALATDTSEDDAGNSDDEVEHNSEGGKEMKHNVFDKETDKKENTLTHSDQESIIAMAKTSNVGSLQVAIKNYAAEHNTELTHGIDGIETLFPEYQLTKPGAPELLTRDQGWVGSVMNKVHKSPITRIRTRQADIRDKKLRASGYVKGKKKKDGPNISLLTRTTDPQTVYRKDSLHRDDIIDITDFDVVEYQYGVMKMNLEEELAMAFMVGDGREEGDEEKIEETHIRSIWHDDDLYTIHTDVDIAAAKKELQGTNTSANFGENYIYAEAIINASLYSREKYKGSGALEFYCTPHLLNQMLLARDLNGRRIYSSVNDLAAALNVTAIHTTEQFEGLTRTTKDSKPKTKKLLGLFVNLDDYHVGSTKGGEITRFNQFDIDFNQEKYLIETRLSGALTRVYSAIALEEDVTAATEDDAQDAAA